ncbi:MAG: PAS domain-containing protein [Gemmataceae bacterium]
MDFADAGDCREAELAGDDGADSIVLFDADGAMRACNASAEHIFGLTAHQLMGRTSRSSVD